MPEYIIPMRIHLPLLKNQKAALLRVLDVQGTKDAALLEGILSLLDHIHDEIDPPKGRTIARHSASLVKKGV